MLDIHVLPMKQRWIDIYIYADIILITILRARVCTRVYLCVFIRICVLINVDTCVHVRSCARGRYMPLLSFSAVG